MSGYQPGVGQGDDWKQAMTTLPTQCDPKEREAGNSGLPTNSPLPATPEDCVVDRVKTGKRLRRLREYLGFTQQEVADYLKVPAPILVLIESGIRSLVVEEIARLCVLYRVSLESVLFARPPSGPPSGIDVTGLGTDDVRELTAFADYLRWRREASRGT